MKKSIYEYIRNHSHTDTHAIAEALNLNELQVLKIVNELQKESYIKMDTPVPLSSSNQNSCYYTATSKSFKED